jgi:hypothetical protein
MAIAFVVSAPAAAQNTAATSAINTTGANLLLIGAGWYPVTTPDPTTVGDNMGNTFTGLTKKTLTNTSLRLWHCVGANVGGGNVSTVAGATEFIGMNVSAWSGAAASPVSVENGNTATSASTIAPGSVNPPEDNCLIVTAVAFQDNTSGAVSIGSGFTKIAADDAPYNGSNNVGYSFAYLIQTTAAAVNPTWNITNSSSELVSVIAVFKGPGGGGGAFTLLGQGVM